MYKTNVVKETVDQSRIKLEAAYTEAAKDPDRLETINDWRPLDVDGWE